MGKMELAVTTAHGSRNAINLVDDLIMMERREKTESSESLRMHKAAAVVRFSASEYCRTGMPKTYLFNERW